MIITRISELIHDWMGWCPNTQPLRTVPPVIATTPVTINPAQLDGGAGGSGRIDRGIRLVTGSIKILIGSRRLLWFSFLTGLVLVFSLITTFGLQFLSGTNPFTGISPFTEPQIALIAKGSLTWLTLTFATQLVTVFCSLFLLAGLITCVSLLFSGRTATIREGLSLAGNHIRPIAIWAVVFALFGTLQSVLLNLYPGNFLLIFALLIIFGLLGLVTIFVIPVLVFENRNLVGAITGSLSLIRRTWAEIILCVFFFWLLGFVIGFLSLIPAVAIGFPSGNPVLLGITIALYLLVLIILIFIGSTAMGIILVGLYSYAKSGRIPEMFEGKQEVMEPI